jgi:hypothetical protein
MDEEYIDIVFDGPPDLQAGAGRFVEVEDSTGAAADLRLPRTMGISGPGMPQM